MVGGVRRACALLLCLSLSLSLLPEQREGRGKKKIAGALFTERARVPRYRS